MINHNLLNYQRDSYLPKDYVIDCSLGFNPYEIPDSIIKSLKISSLRESHKYYSPKEEYFLKECLMKTFERSIEKDNILFTNGTMGAINTISSALIKKGTILGFGPQFIDAVTLFKAHGHDYIFVDIDQYYDKLLKSLSQKLKHNIIAIYIDNPNNPTGFVFSVEKLFKIVDLADKNGIITIIDEAYGDYLAPSESFVSNIKRFNFCICIRSFSKAYGLASFRIGYIVLSDYISKYYAIIHIPYSTSLASIIVAKKLLLHNKYIQSVREKTHKCKLDFMKRLKKMNIHFYKTNPHVPILFVTKKIRNSENFFESNNIRVTDGKNYSFFGEKFNQYCRIRLPNCLEYQDMIHRLGLSFFKYQG